MAVREPLTREWQEANEAAKPGTPAWYMTSMHPDAVAWRGEQAEVDADIEGLARDAEADELERQLEGLPIDEQIERTKAFFREKARQPTAAE
jgi:hypothetical protein